MPSNKQTAHIVIEKANSRLVGTALQHFQNAITANTNNRMPDVILNLFQSTQYLERVIHSVPNSSYEHRYGADAIEKRRFYNIGAGEMWYHPFWTALDISLISSEAGITCNFNDKTPFPIETNTAKLIYSSHCLEHLNQKILDHVLAESYRALEPGGLIRIAVPDIDIFYRAYQRQENDFFININDNSGQYDDLSLQQNFLAQFAYPCCCLSSESPELHMSDSDVENLFKRHPFEKALDVCIERIPNDLHYAEPPHINWLNAEKLSNLLTQTGFEKVTRSACGQSEEMVLCDLACFDYTTPEISLYMEARKPKK